MSTIRDRITAIQTQLADGDITPGLARESLIRLTALMGNVNTELRHADHEYKLVLLGCLKGTKTAAGARINAEVTEQYVRWREAEGTADLVVEMIRSCKAYLRSLDEEMRLAR